MLVIISSLRLLSLIALLEVVKLFFVIIRPVHPFLDFSSGVVLPFLGEGIAKGQGDEVHSIQVEKQEKMHAGNSQCYLRDFYI